MTPRISLLCLLLLLALTSCDQKSVPNKASSAGEDAIAGGFINPDDFQNDDQVDTIDAPQAAKMITALDFFYFQKTISSLRLEETTESKCEIKKDEAMTGADGKTLELTYVFDDENCPDVQNKYINKMNIFISISCSETDLSDYVGKSVRSYLSTAGAKDFCGKDKTQKTFINAQYDRSSADESAKTLGGMMKSDGTACVATFDNGTYNMDDCLFVQKASVIKKDQTSSTSKLIRLKANNLVSKNSGRYYSSGSIDMQINGWKGPMTYSADTTAPTYVIESSGKTVKGSFTAGIYE